MSSVVQGSIVWATVPDSRGANPKARPHVVLTPDSRILSDRIVDLAAITSLVGQARFEETVPLPWHADGHPETGLKKPSEVVCTWVQSVALDDIQNSGFVLSLDLLLQVLEKVDAFN